MRKHKIVAAVMAFAMTVSIYSPMQAAGYCINNGNCSQIVVGGNCISGNAVKDILSNSKCNNNECTGNECTKGASDSNGCNKNNNAAEILQKYITGSGTCGVQSNEQTNTSGDKGCQSSTVNNSSECKQETSSNTSKPESDAGSACKTATDNSSACKTATDNSSTCQPAANKSACQSTRNNICRYIIQYGNSCQSVQGSNCVSQPVTQDKTTEQQSTQRATEQPTTQVTTEQPVTEQEKTTEAATPIEATTEEVAVASMSEDQASAAGQILNLVNQNRSASGLHSLRLDEDLCAAAQIRANEIVTSFSHTRPDGRKFSTVLTDNGIRFTAAGENIAWGQTSPSQVMNAWMNSDGHRANIMNVTYTKLGVGHVTVGGRQYWVQLFSY